MNQKDLRESCILSGTDYNFDENHKEKEKQCKKNLYDTFKQYRKYHNEKIQNYQNYQNNGHLVDNNEQYNGFHNWLLKNTDYIKDADLFKKIYEIFDLDNNTSVDIKPFESIRICYGPMLKSEMKEILQQDGFIFAL